MSDLVASPEAIRGYAAASVAMATSVATAGAFDQTATMAAAAPVFGLIGQDFLFAFGVAQANHASSTMELAAVHAATAAAATAGAAAYDATEEVGSAEFAATQSKIGHGR
ncbi:hypothetical protein AB0H76_37090 [Nocardia sp. NPDC050712]|uniref:hypothetical protein n=1 Tax=Nocardia sp. NPDC050712 TaxID=3155518 RepID=UPI0033F2641B